MFPKKPLSTFGRLFSLAAACTFVLSVPIWAQPHPDFVPGRVLVKFKPTAKAETVKARLAEIQASVEGELSHSGVKILRLPAGAAADAVARAMNSRPDVQFAEVDRYVEPDNTPNDPYFSSQWHLDAIQAPAAWNTNTGNPNIIIAILDTGVDGTHPDLTANMVPGWNFYDNNSNTSDVEGHGTAVAGTAAAMGNDGIGVASVAWNSKIMPIRITDTTGYALYSTAATALEWAADHGARVANLSFMMYSSSAVISAAEYFQSKNGGGVVAMSAGNTGTASTSLATPYILVVGSTNSSNTLSTFSATGPMVDLVAPGEWILTTTSAGGYGAWSGTSFSAPIVAGVAALVLSVQPGLNGPQVQYVLEASAVNLGPAGWDSSYGYGLVNAAAAVSLALTTNASVGNNMPPTMTFVSPLNASTISGVTSVQVNAADNGTIASVSLVLDGGAVGTSTTSPHIFNLNTTGLVNGSHTLTATAVGGAGNKASTSISVTVYNPVVVGNPVVTVRTLPMAPF